MIRKKPLATTALFLVMGTCMLTAQMSPCGSGISMSQINLETTITTKENTFTDRKTSKSLPQLNKTIRIAVYIVKEKEVPYFDASGLDGIVAAASKYFDPISLGFEICSKTTIDNFQLDNATVGENTKDLTIQYSEPNTINLYLVSTLIDTTGRSVYGFAYMPGDKGKNYIFMKKSNFTAETLSHELGHFFNLYHTSETVFGEELPDGTNCATSGDHCCDTDASPDLSLPGMVTECIYTGKLKRNGQIFSPSTKNIMTLGPSDCQCVFSRTQLLRISDAVTNYRNYLR